MKKTQDQSPSDAVRKASLELAKFAEDIDSYWLPHFARERFEALVASFQKAQEKAKG